MKSLFFNRSEENKVAYKSFKNKLRSLIRKAETDYYTNVFNSETESMKEMWKELHSLLSTKKKNKGNSITKLIMNNQEITKDKDIANALDEHLKKNWLKSCWQSETRKEQFIQKLSITDPISESLFLRPANNYEVLKEINQLKNKATTDIRVSLLKYVTQEILA